MKPFFPLKLALGLALPLFALLPPPTLALETTLNGIPASYSLLDNGDAVLTQISTAPSFQGPDETLGPITLPETLDGHRLVSIAPFAFTYTRFSEVSLPNTITNIANEAFSLCPKLTSISLPTSLVSIGAQAFYSCYNLTSIDLPEGLTSLANDAFLECSSLASISIPSTLTTLDTLVFIDLPSLKTLTVHPNNPTYTSRNNILFSKDLHSLLFYAPANPATSYTIPNYVNKIGKYAFYRAVNLSSVTLRASVFSIGDSAFRYCTSLGEITIPGSVDHLPEDTFADCTALIEVIFLSGVRGYTRPFSGCSKLSSVFLPSSITNTPAINNGLLLGTNIPTNINITLANGSSTAVRSTLRKTYPRTNIVLEDYSMWVAFFEEEFNDPDLFSDVVHYDTCAHSINYEYLESYQPGYWSDHNALPSVEYATSPNGPFTCYPPMFTERGTYTVYFWLSFYSFISNDFIGEASITILPPETFDFELVDDEIHITGLLDPTLTNLVIPATINNHPVTTIADHAFWKCTSLSSVTLPETLTSIGDGAFWRCSSLTSITLPASVSSLGDAAFFHCSSLSEIILDGDSPLPSDALLEGTSATLTRIGGTTTASGIPHYWLREHVPSHLREQYHDDMDALEALPAANPHYSYAECYIAGLDPSNPTARFQISIQFLDNHPILTWIPHLPNRTYTLLGSPSLSPTTWEPCDPTNPPDSLHFFRVTASLPSVE